VDHAAFGGDLGKRMLYRSDPLGRRFVSGGIGLQRFDVGLDLNVRAEFLAERVFQAVRDIVGAAERQLA
jgi:hypothetical protein